MFRCQFFPLYLFKTISNNILVSYFIEIEKLILKCIWKSQASTEKNKVEVRTVLNCKTDLQQLKVCYLLKNQYIKSKKGDKN